MPTRRSVLSQAALLAGATLASPGASRRPVYAPTVPSLTAHPLPSWFDDAKFGIFIHWGLYSVPAFAPFGPNPNPAAPDMMRASPYAEWYANTVQFPGSETAAFHRATYGDAPYSAFAAPFEAGAARADFDKWVQVFAKSGARYVTLVTKHHDGYLLWPSATPNPHRPGWQSRTDIVGGMARAVRARGLRFGTYYSGGLDWTFNPARLDNGGAMIRSMPQDDAYDAYVLAHYRDLIARVRPDYLWNDIGYPTQASALTLAAEYYNGNTHGLINDRWLPARETFSGPPEAQLARLREFGKWLAQHRPPPPVHYDVITPEYAPDLKPLEKKWEATRGIGFSFGYNARETAAQLMTPKAIVQLLADCVAKGGNLLLNTGPRGDGTLCPMQVERLLAVGQWLGHSGDAIYGTRPWHTPAATAADGRTVRFTAKGRRVYAIVLEGGADFPTGIGTAGLETAKPAPLGPDTDMPRAWRII